MANATPLTPLRWWGLSILSIVAAFGTYFAMYAFRKPFTAHDFAGLTFWQIDYKTILLTAQVLGYTCSKFLGIKFVSEMSPVRRAGAILGLVVSSHVALLLFAVIPAPWNALALFANGLPLGMVFGLVLGFLEGRRNTEALTAGLCCSFILADGYMKTLGTQILEAGYSPYWMPFLAGAIFLPVLLVCVGLLTRIPPPDRGDIEQRGERVPMKKEDRRAFFRRYAPGLIPLLLAYLFITVLRSMRSDFQPELWKDLGEKPTANVYARTEMYVGLGVILLNGLTVLIRNNRRAFFSSLGIALLGVGLLGFALVAQQQKWLNPFEFMVLIGLGLYLPYIAVHTTIFERLIAMTKDKGNIGYLMLLVDAFGYLGYVGVMIVRNFTAKPGEFLPFFLMIATVLTIGMGVMFLVCMAWFARNRFQAGAVSSVSSEPNV